MATDKGVWNLQQVRDKQLQDLWSYSAPGGDNLRLFSWGYNTRGELGLNQSDNFKLSSPTQITGTIWKDFANTGGYKPNTAIASKTDNTLWSWGRNDQAQMGINDRTDRSSPVQIPGTNWTGTYETMSGAYFQTCAIKTDGTLWSWGYNGNGELGTNNRTQRSSPVQIPGTNWSKIFNGYADAYGIKTDGTLWSWGHAANGALGLNAPSNSHKSSPTQIPGTTWKMGSASERNAMVIKTDGTLWAWGRNETGALGLNQGTNSGQNIATSSPVQIPGTTWSSVTATQQGGLAIKTDGTLWAWGDNEWGTLGQNSNINYSSPVQVGSDTTWNIVNSGGHYKVRAIKTDGTLWSWGLNEGGQAGLNNRTNYSSPVQVGSDTDWDKIGGVNNTSFGLRQP